MVWLITTGHDNDKVSKYCAIVFLVIVTFLVRHVYYSTYYGGDAEWKSVEGEICQPSTMLANLTRSGWYKIPLPTTITCNNNSKTRRGISVFGVSKFRLIGNCNCTLLNPTNSYYAECALSLDDVYYTINGTTIIRCEEIHFLYKLKWNEAFTSVYLPKLKVDEAYKTCYTSKNIGNGGLTKKRQEEFAAFIVEVAKLGKESLVRSLNSDSQSNDFMSANNFEYNFISPRDLGNDCE